MGISIVWPGFWLTAAFICALMVFAGLLIGKASSLGKDVCDGKSEAVLKIIKCIVTNGYVVGAISIIYFLMVFVAALYLMHSVNADEFCFMLFMALSAAMCLPIVLAGSDNGPIVFVVAGIICAVFGLCCMVFVHFSYIWHMLGFLAVGVVFWGWMHYSSE